MSCCSIFCKKRRETRQSSSHHNEDVPGGTNITKYTYKELVRATDNFNQSNKIGEGGFGSVYKLNDAGTAQEWNNCCCQGPFVGVKTRSSRHSNIQFDWRTRVNICLGIARGLAYLHHGVTPHIVHRDIKASNILLDKDLTPKISDFGLAKLLPPNATHVSTRVAGTLGYLAPEYAIRGQVTRKSDVYSFGVLLLEIVSGRSNSDTRLAYEDQILLEKTWMYYEQGILEKIVDRSLGSDLDVAQACRFLKVGLLCTQDVTRHRPDMSKAIALLTGETDIESEKISKPAIISDFMDLKVRSMRKANDIATSSTFVSSLMAHSSPLLSNETTQASMASTGVSDRD